ncbi:MAG: hypothetical protein H0V11_03625 [Actinobacteria bacterium]|nr:hypothetical protein [Actinomycetota bacterium]
MLTRWRGRCGLAPSHWPGVADEHYSPKIAEELRSGGHHVVSAAEHEPCERPWGMLEIRVRDLNGYVLGIGEPL